MNKEKLNEKIWYRALKVVFVLAFLIAQAFNFFLASSDTKILYSILSFLVISVIFWIIARIFFYIIFGEKFLKIK